MGTGSATLSIGKALRWLSVAVAVAAILAAVYKRDHAYDYVDSLRQEAVEWLGEDPWHIAGNHTELRAVLSKLSSHIEIKQFQMWISGAFYAAFPYAKDPTRISHRLYEQGVRAKYPVIIIPGFVTSGLELWKGMECFKGYFRARLWTKYNMARLFLSNKACWMEHLSLNFTNGLDPDGIRVRNAQGLDAVDFFFPGYDVWAKVITSLADIGYDGQSMVALPYDWRLSIPNLELRDAYFTRLRSQIEQFKTIYDEKVLIAAHSWGDNVARNFLAWMEAEAPGWVDEHIAVHFNIAGPNLGVPKALTSLLSGELRETANLLGVASVIGEQLLGKEERTLVWRTWGSAYGMLPAGGSSIWGNTTWAPDDGLKPLLLHPDHSFSLGTMLSVLENSDGEVRALDVEAAVGELVKDAGPTLLRHVQLWSSATLPEDTAQCIQQLFGHEHEDDARLRERRTPSQARSAAAESTLEAAETLQPRHKARDRVPLYDPLTTPLPKAPNMRVYCGYGHGIATERAYYYRHDGTFLEEDQCPAQQLEASTRLTLGQIAAGKTWHIDSSVEGTGHSIVHGVALSDGDGTVPLLSLGYMCASGWRNAELNPSGMKVVLREYEDKARISMAEPRGGPGASSHVEVLGNNQFLQDLLYAAAGWHEAVDVDMVGSDIHRIAKRIDER